MKMMKIHIFIFIFILPDFARSLWRVAKGNMSNGAHTQHQVLNQQHSKTREENFAQTQPHSHHKRVKHQSWLIPLPLCSSIGIISTAERIIQWHQVGKLFLVTFSDIDPPTYF
jgi:hypothetical protein